MREDGLKIGYDYRGINLHPPVSGIVFNPNQHAAALGIDEEERKYWRQARKCVYDRLHKREGLDINTLQELDISGDMNRIIQKRVDYWKKHMEDEKREQARPKRG